MIIALTLLLRLFATEPTCAIVALGEEYTCETSLVMDAGDSAGMDPQED